MYIVEVFDLTKEYQYIIKEAGIRGAIKALFKPKHEIKRAVDEVNFTIKKGEIVGLIGPNGAGKTTIIKMLTGIIKPTSGKMIVLGENPAFLTNDLKRKYAVVMGQKSQLWWDLPAIDTFYLNKEIYQISNEKFEETLSYLVHLFCVENLLNVQVRQLSLGERMKMEIIACLLHEPQIVFLDEPTIGLDAIAQIQIRNLLIRINKEKGITIILTSHYMEDIENLCDRVIIVNDGKKIFDGNLDELMNEHREYKVVCVNLKEKFKIMINKPVEWLERSDFRVSMKVRKEDVNIVLKEILEKYEVSDISIEEESLSNLISKIYEEKKAE